MGEYWSQHRFMPKAWERLSGAQVRAEIRQKLHAFHNAVNERLGKPCPTLESLHPSLNRIALGAEIQALFEGLREEWGAAHIEWKRTGALLIRLVQSGPQ
jgi:hypothetical protein